MLRCKTFVLPNQNDANPAEREHACNCAAKSSSTPGLGLALPRFAVEVRCGRALDGSLVLRKVRGLQERLLDELLLAEDTADGLVVGKLGELEEDGVENGRGVFLIGLEGC